jgi:hypothetical protein
MGNIPLLCRQVIPANKLVVILIPTVVNKHENKAGPRKEQSSVRLWPHFYRAFQTCTTLKSDMLLSYMHSETRYT